MQRTIDETLCGEKRTRLLQDIVDSTVSTDGRYKYSASEAARRTGMSVRNVRRCLKDFLQSGLITQVGQERRPGKGGSPVKHYAATETGTRATAVIVVKPNRTEGDMKGDVQSDTKGDMKSIGDILTPSSTCETSLPPNKVPNNYFHLIDASIENGRLSPDDRNALVTIAQICPIEIDDRHSSNLIDRFAKNLELGYMAADMIEAVDRCARWHRYKTSTHSNYKWRPWVYKIIEPGSRFMIRAREDRERREASATNMVQHKVVKSLPEADESVGQDEAVEIAEALDELAPKRTGRRMGDVVAAVRLIASSIPDAHKWHFVEAYKKYLEYTNAKDYVLMWLTNRTSTSTYDNPRWAVAHMLVINEGQAG